MAERSVPDTVSRRTVLKGMAGVAGLASVPAIVAACSSSGSSPSAAASAAASAAPPASAPAGGSAAPSGSTAVGNVSIGSYHTDPGEPEGQKAVDAAFTQATGIAVKENIVDHSTFQNQISNYLGGTPDTAYTWFSGFRMKFFADKGLSVPIDDLWAKVKDNFAEGFQQAVVGNDGKVYGIPVDYYPWAVFYRKSVFQDKGYTVPKTWDEFKALCTKMQGDNLTPIAFADQEGWPAMGTFDILNLRLNGYDFHVGLMAGDQKWTDPKVTAVFQKWAEIMPFHSKDYAGKKWTDAATTLLNKQSGMFLLGLFMSSVFSATKKPEDIDDLDFFPYPNLGTQYDAEAALDAPIDTWQIAAKSPNLDKEKDAALDAGHLLRAPAGLHPDGQGRRHQQVLGAPEEGRRGRRQREADHPVPRPRHSVGLRRAAGHAGLPPDVPEEPDRRHRGAPEADPGLLGRPSAADLGQRLT